MTRDASITIEGLEEVFRTMDRAVPKIVEAANKGIQKGALQVIADAKVNLRDNHNVVTGALRASGRVERIDNETIEAGFFDTSNREGYAAYVEYGRRAGGMPPRSNLAAWAYKKFRLKDWRHAWAIATNLARRIADRGTTPHPYFGPALEKNKEYIVKCTQEAVADCCNNVKL